MKKLYLSRLFCLLLLPLFCLPGFRPALAQFTPDGTWNPADIGSAAGLGASGRVRVIKVLPNGEKLIGGTFSQYNGTPSIGLARINGNGDAISVAVAGTGLTGPVSVHAIERYSGTKFLVCGRFLGFNGTPRSGVVRLNATTTTIRLDTTFSPAGANDTVFCAAVQPDGKILLGGAFTRFNGDTCNRIVRLMPDGSLDPSFSTGSEIGFNGTVRSLVLDTAGNRLYVGGDFTQYKHPSDTTLVRSGLVCLNASDGRPVATANAGAGTNPGGRVNVVYRIPATGELCIGGHFSAFGPLPRKSIAKILADGSPDPDFNPTNLLEAEVHDITESREGRGGLVLGGNFTLLAKAPPRRGIIKLTPKGTMSITDSACNDSSVVFSLERDTAVGKIIIGGDFTKICGLNKTRITRILETAEETSIWDGTDWDWGEPDCDFSALMAGHYKNQPGFTCKTLTILPTIKFFPDSTVWVCRHAYNYSTNDSIAGLIYLKGLNGDALHEVEGIFDDLSLDDDSGAVVSDPAGGATILGTLKTLRGNFETSDQLKLRSRPVKTGRIGRIDSTVAGISGKVTMERFVPGGVASWHFLGTPIIGQVKGDWDPDDFVMPKGSIYRHEENNPADSGWVLHDSAQVPVGRGFRVWLNKSFFNSTATFDNTGFPHTGFFRFKISYSPGGYGGGGWNFLANPYPSEIDWHAFSKSNMTNDIHYWNGNAYGSYNSFTEVGINGAGRYIPSSQGFFVKAISASPLPALSVTELAKPDSAPNPVFLRSAVYVAGEVARIRLLGENLPSDETAIRWMEGVENSFENESDTRKMRNPGLNLYSLSSEGLRSSIQSRVASRSDSVHLGLSVPAPGMYQLDLRMGDALLSDKSWFIFDHARKAYYRLSASTMLPFFAGEGETASSKRFTLLARPLEEYFQAGTISKKYDVFPNPARDGFLIYGLEKEVSFRLEQLNGKTVLQGNTMGPVSCKGLTPGIYILRFSEPDKVQARLKLVVSP